MRHRQALSIPHELRCAVGDCTAVEALVPVEYGGFMLMPSNQDLTAAEVRLIGMITGGSSNYAMR